MLHSWVESANRPQTDFPIQNLPFGVFGRRGNTETASIGLAIGDQILNLRACAESGLLDSLSPQIVRACSAPSLNELMALGQAHASAVRKWAAELLSAGSPQTEQNRGLLEPMLLPAAEATMLLPAVIGDYSDFYASIHHALNVGSLFRPGAPLLPNYRHVPIAYHGRASSIVPSGVAIVRPHGQIKEIDSQAPVFAPSGALDYESEVGFFVGTGNRSGEPIPIETSESHIFGLCLVNDWSARDIQAWEYQPLGPFLGKSFATTISPWIVSLEALEPFRAPAFKRDRQDPQPLQYLTSARNSERGAFDITLEIYLASCRMREMGIKPLRLSRGNLQSLFWTAAQMVTHHTSNGCNLRPGDLIASGTVSGAAQDSLGSIIELTKRGIEPIHLPTGEQRKFLEDGDEVIVRGYCERDGWVRIGFGECRGTIVSANSGSPKV